MGKHETIDAAKEQTDAKPVLSDAASATLVPGDGADEAMKSALAAIEQLKLENPNMESPAEMPKAEPVIASAVAAITITFFIDDPHRLDLRAPA